MPHQNVNWPTHTSPLSGGNRRACPHKVSGKPKDLYSKRRAIRGVGGVCVYCVLFCFQGRGEKSHSFICLQVFFLWLNQESTQRKKKNENCIMHKKSRGKKNPKHLFWTTVLPNTQTSPRNALLLFWNPTTNYVSLIKKEGSGARSDLGSQTSK